MSISKDMELEIYFRD